MNIKTREAQQKILTIFSEKAKNFALSDGTALELYYLNHRFSADLDFFSPRYDLAEIDGLVSAFKKFIKCRIRLESEFIASGRARVRFYEAMIGELERPIKIDFVEDVLFKNPKIKKFVGIPVYSAKNIYLQKIVAITGIRLQVDEVGRQIMEGRKEARDVFDIYMLSKKIEPLHRFLKSLPRQFQRGMIQWYRLFPRREVKLALLDLDIYNRQFDSKEMIIYLENEIERFAKEVIE